MSTKNIAIPPESQPTPITPPDYGIPARSGRKMTPQQEKYLSLIRQLTDHSVTMVVRVAVCKCKDRENCEVFLKAREIAEIINELQKTRPAGVRVGKGRR